MSARTMNSDEIFQHRVLLELQHIRIGMGELRSELSTDIQGLRQEVGDLRTDVRELRSTTIECFVLIDILRRRVDRIERHLEL